MEVQIPKSAEGPLKKFAELEPKQLDRFVQAIQSAEPAFGVDRFAAKVAEASDVDEQTVGSIIAMLVGMYLAMTQSGVPRDRFVSGLVEALQPSLRAWSVDNTRVAAVRSAMGEVLASDESLGLTAKALDLLRDHEHAFCSARVITDVRHIFGADPRERPKAAVMVHMLHIVCHEIDDMKEMYFAMDSSDLRKLRDAIQRAEAKESNLKEMLREFKVRYLGE